MHWVTHSLKIALAKERGHGRIRNFGRLPDEEGMATFLVTAAVVTVMGIVMMQEG